MSSRVPQPAESFDSTAKLMVEAFAKASAELEKSVTAFTEQLISFNEGLQKSLEEELRSVNGRLEGSIKTNLDELGYSKHLMLKRLNEAEHEELNVLSDAGKAVRSALAAQALQMEQRIESFIDEQISSLKEFLQQPESQLKAGAESATRHLSQTGADVGSDIKDKSEALKRRLSDKVAELELLMKAECDKVKESIISACEEEQNRLYSQKQAFSGALTKFADDAVDEMVALGDKAMSSLEECESKNRRALSDSGDGFRHQINLHCDTFNKSISNLSSVLKQNYQTKLTNVSELAKQEISKLSEKAHEKISETKSELDVELREVENEYGRRFDELLRKLEAIVMDYANDKRNSGMARQHKSQKLRDQMQTHLKRWGSELVDSVKDASQEFENDYSRATDGFHMRMEGARSAAVELLERESRLMQKDIERTLKDFQRELSELEAELGRIEKAGHDAVTTVIAWRKAMLL